MFDLCIEGKGVELGTDLGKGGVESIGIEFFQDARNGYMDEWRAIHLIWTKFKPTFFEMGCVECGRQGFLEDNCSAPRIF